MQDKEIVVNQNYMTAVDFYIDAQKEFFNNPTLENYKNFLNVIKNYEHERISILNYYNNEPKACDTLNYKHNEMENLNKYKFFDKQIINQNRRIGILKNLRKKANNFLKSSKNKEINQKIVEFIKVLEERNANLETQENSTLIFDRFDYDKEKKLIKDIENLSGILNVIANNYEIGEELL